MTDAPKIRFYAGSPIVADDGHRIGTLCIIDRKPRELNDEELEDLRGLTTMVERELAAATLATTDELTGLTNRRGLLTLGEHTLALSRRSRQPVTALFFDLNGFKQINDEFGHAEGDRALIDFGQALLHAFRDSDVVARIGGDEFCVLTAGSDEAGLRRPLEELDEALVQRRRTAIENRDIRYSVGACGYNRTRHGSVADLLAEADREMYATKKQEKRPARSAS